MATTRHKKPENFLNAVARHGSGLQIEDALDAPTQATEALLMGLRLREGVDISALSDRFAFDSGDMIDFVAVDKLSALGFINRVGEQISVTLDGFPLLDAILPQIVAIEPAPAA